MRSLVAALVTIVTTPAGCNLIADIDEASAVCGDGQLNADESDLDCGGSVCDARCGLMKHCAEDSDCVAGTACGCIDGCEHPRVCVPTIACQSNRDCAGDHVCNRFFSQCTPPGGAGIPCAYNGDCTPDYFCSCDEVCVPRRGDGDSCTAAGSECLAGSYCADGACQRGDKLGAPCEWGHCDLGLYCHYDVATRKASCAGLLPEKADCFDIDSCEPGFFCDIYSDAFVCAPVGNVGDDCRSDDACASDLFCPTSSPQGGVRQCAPLLPLGAQCDSVGSPCASKTCRDEGVGPVCSPRC